jgi:CDP-glucose 4,6-dehydratase
MEHGECAVESLEVTTSLAQTYRGKRVFLTGHTGFKGAWLALWLKEMGAHVTGYALPPQQTPDSLYALLNLSARIDSHYGDLSDLAALRMLIKKTQPEIVFHLAAQPLVLPSYATPVDTFATNIMGTVHMLEAIRLEGADGLAVVNVTTDKCYLNNDVARAFKEDDALGGHDPYSASKAAVEIVSASYRASFLAKANIAMATTRAGNVIGGGDFGEYRLIPDIIRSVHSKVPVSLRHPKSTRPWQHVLDVLNGYLMLGQALLNRNPHVADAFNIGPDIRDIDVGTVAEKIIAAIGNRTSIVMPSAGTPLPHEAATLALDNSKAKAVLGWKPQLTPQEAIELTAAWYQHYFDNRATIGEMTHRQLDWFSAQPAQAA